jgi:hypothetical protein
MTCGAVGGELLLYVVRTDSLIEFIGMTTRACIGRVGEVSSGMALVAIVRNSCVSTNQGVEIIVYGKSGGAPACIGRVAVFTRDWQIQLSVIRILTLCIIITVTAIAGIGCIVIIAMVTRGTVCCNVQVRSGKHKEIVVDGKCGRFPCRGGMTGGTIGGDIQVQVTGVGCLHVLIVMATCAGCGCTLESGIVALHTLRSLVSSGEREARQIMIEYIGGISGRVAGQTGCTVVGIAVYALVLLIRIRIGMTVYTGNFSVIGRVGVAIGTLVPFSLVITAVYGEILCVMVKTGGRPCRFTVATGTIGRKLR